MEQDRGTSSPTPIIISVPATVKNMKPRADRSWDLVFETRELSGDEVKILVDNFQGEGWLLFKPNGQVSIDEIPDGDADSGVKSQSYRLRASIMAYWRRAGGKGDAEAFYRTTMEKLREYINSKE